MLASRQGNSRVYDNKEIISHEDFTKSSPQLHYSLASHFVQYLRHDAKISLDKKLASTAKQCHQAPSLWLSTAIREFKQLNEIIKAKIGHSLTFSEAKSISSNPYAILTLQNDEFYDRKRSIVLQPLGLSFFWSGPRETCHIRKTRLKDCATPQPTWTLLCP